MLTISTQNKAAGRVENLKSAAQQSIEHQFVEMIVSVYLVRGSRLRVRLSDWQTALSCHQENERTQTAVRSDLPIPTAQTKACDRQ